MIPVLETERLVLRAWRVEDVDTFAAIYGDEETSRYIGGLLPREEAWRRLAYTMGHFAMRGFGFFALDEKASGACIGWCGPYFPEGWPDREIGWTLLPHARGKGYATEAARRARAYAYNELGWDTAISFIAIPNSASIAVAHRLGATLESTRIYRGIETGVFRHPSATDIANAKSIH